MSFENDSLNFMNEIEDLLNSRCVLNDKKVYETIKVCLVVVLFNFYFIFI
jgi:hypothetical protein